MLTRDEGDDGTVSDTLGRHYPAAPGTVLALSENVCSRLVGASLRAFGYGYRSAGRLTEMCNVADEAMYAAKRRRKDERLPSIV